MFIWMQSYAIKTMIINGYYLENGCTSMETVSKSLNMHNVEVEFG